MPPLLCSGGMARRMTQRPSAPSDVATWSAVDRYYDALLKAADPILEAALAESRSAGLPEIQVSPLLGKLLHLLARAHRPQRILEIGTLGGYSTIWLARGLPSDGRLVTIELSAHHADVARANIARAALDHQVEIRVGPALEVLPRLESEGAGPFDMVFIDADKPSYPEYVDWSVKLARPGTVILADNVVRRGDVIDTQSEDVNVQGIRRMNEAISRNPRLSATAIQTVGAKGHDGFLLALVLPAQ